MAGTVQAGTLISSNSRSIDVDDIGVRSYAGGGGAFNYRNKIVDGRFDFWYEGTSKDFAGGDTGFFTSTMWRIATSSTVGVHSQGLLVDGELPDVPTASYYSRTQISSFTSSATSQSNILQRIENVNTLAGKTVTLSWYARSPDSKDISVEVVQNFGNGTGASSEVTSLGTKRVTLTPTFQRFTSTFTLPSIAGKNIVDGLITNHLRIIFWFSSGSGYSSRNNNLPEQIGTFDIACVQLEEGTVATPFEELPVSVSEQRLGRYYQYYLLSIDTPISYNPSNSAASQVFMRNVPMRTIPTMTLARQDGAIVKKIGGSEKAISTSMYVTHNTLFYYDIRCNFTSYTYAAGDFININTYVISDARL